MAQYAQISLFQWVKTALGYRVRGALKTRPTRPITNRPRRVAPPPAAELQAIWNALRTAYFPERDDLNDYVVYWSKRPQRRVLASCNVIRRAVAVARELDHPEYLTWLEPLLYHELCHAVLGTGVERRSGKRAWHGAEFRALERRHGRIPELDRWIREGGFRRAVRRARARTIWEDRRR